MLRLGTIRTPTGTRCVRVDTDSAVEVGCGDVGELLASSAWRAQAEAASGPTHALEGLEYATLVTRPEKVMCVGLNYRDHIAEMGNELPSFPTLFPKFARTLIGAHDPISLPPESTKVDWEAELTVVIGAEVRRATASEAAGAIAGYTVANDITMRDYQRNTSQFTAGKMWEGTTPVGPWLVVADESSPAPARAISCTVDGETMQSSNTDQLLFDPVHLVQYISTIITLAPGDLILTGTPGGVGAGREPQRFLAAGELVVTTIDGIGECRNLCA
ncbi:MAG TPA: fumarylacetoacetate hydrolase family protein [Ilumatobacter sp.]|nr:fumarylacetoacetate hydrolase family protein [Ilumatobacter sp.]